MDVPVIPFFFNFHKYSFTQPMHHFSNAYYMQSPMPPVVQCEPNKTGSHHQGACLHVLLCKLTHMVFTRDDRNIRITYTLQRSKLKH